MRWEELLSDNPKTAHEASFVAKDEIDIGKVVEVTEHSNGSEVVIQEPMADFELGFSIYFDEYIGDRPALRIGDDIKIVGLDAPEGIRKLAVNDEVWFDYTREQAVIIRRIRKLRREITQLQEKLDGRAG